MALTYVAVVIGLAHDRVNLGADQLVGTMPPRPLGCLSVDSSQHHVIDPPQRARPQPRPDFKLYHSLAVTRGLSIIAAKEVPAGIYDEVIADAARTTDQVQQPRQAGAHVARLTTE